MELPQLTPLQFLVVHLLFSGPKSPAELRTSLRELGILRSLGSFSRLIRRLQCGLCLEAVHDEPVRGNARRQCHLAVTDLGVTTWNATREFYTSLSAPPPELTPVATEAGKLAHYPPRIRRSILNRRAAKELREALQRYVRSRIKAGARRRAE